MFDSIVLFVSVPKCSVPWYKSCRYALAAISFLGFVNIYAQRVGVSVAIVCMVNQTAVRMNDPTYQTVANGNMTTVAYDSNVTSGLDIRDDNVGGCVGWGGGDSGGYDVSYNVDGLVQERRNSGA